MGARAVEQSAPRRRPFVAGGPVVLALVVVIVVAAGVLIERRLTAPDAVCTGLGGRVVGLDVIHWDNGYTASGPSWFAALTDGVAYGDAPSRQAIATSVAADTDGYDAMVAPLDPADRAAFDRLRAVAIDPTSAPADPGTAPALSTVRHLATARCNLV